MDKSLRKMRKIELLELLLEQEQEIERLQKENGKLQEQLAQRRLQIEEAGSLAEAALRLSGVFEAAQKAADIYLQSLKPESEPQIKPESEPESESKEAENVEKTQEREPTISDGNQGRTGTAEGQTAAE